MGTPENKIVKKRLLFGIGGSLLFVFLGWYIFSSAEKQNLISGNIVELIGIAAMIFFGIATLIGIRKFLAR